MRRVFHRTRTFAAVHDRIPAFHVASIVLTILAAVLLNIGAFAVLILAHAALDIIKYRDVHAFGWGRSLLATAREALADLFFLVLALCFAFYLHHGESVFVLSGIVRMEEVLIRLFGIALPRLEVMVHGMWVFTNVRQHLSDTREGTGPLRFSELFFLCGLLASLLFLASVPFFMDGRTVTDVLARYMVPWRI